MELLVVLPVDPRRSERFLVLPEYSRAHYFVCRYCQRCQQNICLASGVLITATVTLIVILILSPADQDSLSTSLWWHTSDKLPRAAWQQQDNEGNSCDNRGH